MSIEYRHNTSSQLDILYHLQNVSSAFVHDLSNRVDVKEYSQKLFSMAEREEAWSGDNLIGLVAYYINHDTQKAFITNVSVDIRFQKQGIATKLLENAKCVAIEERMKLISLEAANDDELIAFYLHNGFSLHKRVMDSNSELIMHLVPMVVIRCTVYNHEPYLRDCLEGFVMQQTNFPFVAIVHDDASTDNSAAIIREYEEKYPNIIKPIYETENQYSKQDGSLGRIMNAAIEATGAKYVAMCEGDDYWTDPLKLQKQVDFMEANPDYVLCCHRYKIYNQNDGTWSDDYVKNMFELAPNGFSFTNKENLSHWATKTMTLLFRRAAEDKMPTRKIFRYWRDVHLNYYLLKEGPGYCFPFVGAVARRHSGGVFSSIGAMNQWRINLKVWNELVEHNREDDVLLSFYKSQHEGYRASVRNKIRDMRMYELLLDIRTLFYLDYHYGGVKEVIYSVKKILLSFWYLMKTKLNLK